MRTDAEAVNATVSTYGSESGRRINCSWEYGQSGMSRSSPGTWGGEGHSGKREEHVTKIVLSTLQVVHRGGRIGETAGEMGKDVRGLEHHA